MHNTFNGKLNDLIQTAQKYLSETYDMEVKLQSNVTLLMIRSFDDIVTTCKEEISDADEKHVAFILKTLCSIDVNNLNKKELFEQVERFLSRYINPVSKNRDDFFAVNEKNIISMINLKQNCIEALKMINSECNYLRNKNLGRMRFAAEIDKYNALAARLENIQNLLEKRIEYDADKILDSIVENFYIIYIFLVALYRYTQYNSAVIDYVIILSLVDRMLYIVDPLLQSRALKSKYLLYYHVVFELKELRLLLLSQL
ncbi:MAG: hypothetical protein PHX44_00440 [Sulfurimonas sp.]|uniref:hypothetical protein n=1 Tax=Sulfurimonas sp. TaxID=2022749 RepID=UPI002617E28E|nr:hypothetical protein [Sulfurimonas sp.]MDD2651504.1 hypothetical protein [Sulfurimonas sp.]MDD3451045.1 hypothetical protein [Sulfurimonas sp.]